MTTFLTSAMYCPAAADASSGVLPLSRATMYSAYQSHQSCGGATASNDPHCTVNPATVPKALDVITPEGVLQAQELDYTVNQPVTIQGVFIP